MVNVLLKTKIDKITESKANLMFLKCSRVCPVLHLPLYAVLGNKHIAVVK